METDQSEAVSVFLQGIYWQEGRVVFSYNS